MLRTFLEGYTKCCELWLLLETILFEITTVIVYCFSKKKKKYTENTKRSMLLPLKFLKWEKLS